MMYDPSSLQKKLLTFYRQQIADSQALELILDTEAEAIRSGREEDLETLSEQKLVLVQALQDLQEKHDRQVEEMGYDVHPDGLKRLLAWCDQTGILASERHKLMQVMQRCQTKNETVGVMIKGCQQRVQQALSVLHNRSDHDGCYGPAGTLTTPRQVRLLSSI